MKTTNSSDNFQSNVLFKNVNYKHGTVWNFGYYREKILFTIIQKDNLMFKTNFEFHQTIQVSINRTDIFIGCLLPDLSDGKLVSHNYEI